MGYQQRIMNKVDRLTASDSSLEPLRPLFNEYLSTGNIGAMKFGGEVGGILQTSGIDESNPVYAEVIDAAKEAGIYSPQNVKSPQEFALLQSDRGEEGIGSFKGEPYQPFALVMGAALEDVREARNRTKPRAWASYFGVEGDFIRISVESIDSEGRTIRDPIPLQEDGTPRSEFKYSANFPFRRK